ncbi:MAG: TIGR01621 family pseudouridine synthase [Desulfobacterales bacterium]|nr:TIGR01621 family pseudouridine synthase [Desulfobacterales bacterium]MCP4163650.1 TIGR01621 family pseudouridine synthase [Deltaproteobacteria bacterium]
MYTLISENDDFIVIDKNQGVDFHTSADSESLINYVREKEKKKNLFPVHRLDRMTSGLILFAKSKEAASGLSLLFQDRKIEKYYLALSDKKPKKSQGLISGDMERGRRGAWKLLRTKDNPAQTRFFSKSCGGGLRLFILKPLTGKTHQLRVALKSIGSPALGDPLYYRGESNKYDRGYLHSYALRFDYLSTSYCFVSVPDKGILFNEERFVSALENFKEPWLLKWPGSA